MIKKIVGALIALCFLATPWLGQAQTPEEQWTEQIEHWIEQLTLKDDRFSAFAAKNQQWQALEADGSYWLIGIGEPDRSLGYLIVSEEDANLRLIEYGLGNALLFSEQPYVPLPTSDKTPFYAGLESVWVTEEGRYDAKSGEKYPINESLPTFQATDAIDGEILVAIHFNENNETDRTRPWINPGPELNNHVELIDSIEQNVPVSYVAQLFNGEVLAPFDVQGYHLWEDTLFIELEDDGSRFISIQHAKQLGAFYP